jgi:hypothetical protein
MTATIPTTDEQTDAEVAAHAILELAATHAGQFGRLRAARIVGGYAVQLDEQVAASIAPNSSIVFHWSLRDLVSLVDALLVGGLLMQTAGQRPTLVVTRAGHRALDALEQARPRPVPYA